MSDFYLARDWGKGQTIPKPTRLYKLPICPTVNLWIANDGFAFVHAKFGRRAIDTLHDWADWEYHYPPYLRDGLTRTVYAFLDSFPDWAKGQVFYQRLQFKAED